MNYLTEIKLFYEWLEMQEDLSPSAIALWHGLMFIANKSGWKEELNISTSKISLRTNLPTPSIYRVRKELVEAGLISVESRGGRSSATYRIHSLESHFASLYDRQRDRQDDRQSDRQDDRQSDRQTPFVSQCDRQRDSIYKHKQDLLSDKEKPKKKRVSGSKDFSLEEWVSAIESPWREIMRIWLEYKKARKEGYSSEMGAKACLTKLRNLSGNNPDTAQAIVEQSMANNWAGLFPLSGGGNGARGHPPNPLAPATGQRIGQIMQPETEEHRNAILQKFKRKAAEDMSHRPTNPEESTK